MQLVDALKWMDSDSGKATLPVSVLSPFSVADNLNGTNLLIKEQMYSFKKDLSLEGFCFPGKQIESHEGFPPSCNCRKTWIYIPTDL